MTIDPNHRAVLVRVPKSFTPGDDDEDLYEAARQWWVVGAARRDGGPASPEFALPVLGGHVVGAFRIEGWEPRPDGRWGFHGRVSTELREQYLGADVRDYFPQGAANPLRFVNCDTGSGPGPSLEEARTAAPREVEIDVAQLVAEINAEPLAHLMFGHRELFHTNLLAWCFEHLPDVADRIWQQLTAPGAEQSRLVRREWQHLDLFMSWPGRQPLVVENKVFSLTDEHQLARYGALASVQEHEPALVLLSLHDPGWANGSKTLGESVWRRVGYDWLADAINDALPRTDTAYEIATMRRYASLVRALSRLAERVRVLSTSEPVALPETVVAALSATRLVACHISF